MNVKYNNENNMNAKAYSNHPTGFRLGGRNDSEKELSSSCPFYSLSSSCLTRGSIKQQYRLDSRFRGNDRKSELSSSDLIGGSIRQRNHYYGFSGRTPDGVCRRMTGMECGRSMVEMLGTLAIIGVLSIGGIAGYSYGMDKYRANTTINDINLRSIDLLTQKENGQELNLDQWGTHSTVGYEWGDYGYVTGHDAVDMSLLGVPKRVCEMIVDGADTSITQISIDSVAAGDGTACNDNNDMTFYYGTPETCGETECDFETICLYGLESGTQKKECRKYGIFKCAEIDGEEWCSIWTKMYDKKHIPNWYHADKICGLLGKRLPTTDELWNSTTNGPTDLMNELKNKGFINTSYPTQVWTATQVNSTTAYMVSITSGLSEEPKTRTYHSWSYIAVCRGN